MNLEYIFDAAILKNNRLEEGKLKLKENYIIYISNIGKVYKKQVDWSILKYEFGKYNSSPFFLFNKKKTYIKFVGNSFVSQIFIIHETDKEKICKTIEELKKIIAAEQKRIEEEKKLYHQQREKIKEEIKIKEAQYKIKRLKELVNLKAVYEEEKEKKQVQEVENKLNYLNVLNEKIINKENEYQTILCNIKENKIKNSILNTQIELIKRDKEKYLNEIEDIKKEKERIQIDFEIFRRKILADRRRLEKEKLLNDAERKKYYEDIKKEKEDLTNEKEWIRQEHINIQDEIEEINYIKSILTEEKERIRIERYSIKNNKEIISNTNALEICEKNKDKIDIFEDNEIIHKDIKETMLESLERKMKKKSDFSYGYIVLGNKVIDFFKNIYDIKNDVYNIDENVTEYDILRGEMEYHSISKELCKEFEDIISDISYGDYIEENIKVFIEKICMEAGGILDSKEEESVFGDKKNIYKEDKYFLEERENKLL